MSISLQTRFSLALRKPVQSTPDHASPYRYGKSRQRRATHPVVNGSVQVLVGHEVVVAQWGVGLGVATGGHEESGGCGRGRHGEGRKGHMGRMGLACKPAQGSETIAGMANRGFDRLGYTHTWEAQRESQPFSHYPPPHSQLPIQPAHPTPPPACHQPAGNHSAPTQSDPPPPTPLTAGPPATAGWRVARRWARCAGRGTAAQRAAP